MLHTRTINIENIINKMTTTNTVKITPSISAGGGAPLFFILGPCVIENEQHTLYMAQAIKEICSQLNIPFIFKASFDKANRTSIQSYRGPGIQKGLAILTKIKEEYEVAITTDVHQVSQVKDVAPLVDIIQIPAFLCRQTDLILAAAETGKAINIKKGQFIAPWDVENIIKKANSTGNKNVLITERGTCFGYNNLVVDMRSFAIIRELGCPVIFDVTHSLQLPSGKKTCSGGQPEYIPIMAKAAVAAGIDGIFMEVHNNPEKALCDGPNSLELSQLKNLLKTILQIDIVIRKSR
jgi:2-dehydro-3-deoxyphosphooctonate aldolase (KDO 8-P synthase)